ncbi:putative ABC transporter ATP-binding protein [bioreactor metagenome]|uniref:Putative ABC transporter ATP-binding protein n=1 Tax=bioreactor metagenome TaxID=1076179 RepID=A0A645E2K3_9ZZZZ
MTVSKELVGAIFTAIAFILCSIGVMNNNITIGELIAFTAYLPRLFGLFNVLSSSNVYIQKQLGLLNKNFEFLAMEDEYRDSPNSSSKEILGSIEFNNLKFSYDHSREILKDVSFSINQGELATIMGDSGCGKSTLLDLLLGFYKAPPNCIKVDGIDINSYSIDYLRSNIALVSQNISLLRGSLRYNLALANPKATKEEISKIIEAAELSDVIAKLPNGLDSDLSENGINLSGGERQRLALAMALLRKPKILLLDEVSASLDLEAEKRILDTIERLCKNENLTVISVTHRRTFIKDDFRVISMENGEVKYDGKYKDYLEKSSSK